MESKELRALVSKVNKRLERMSTYLGSDAESIENVRQQLYVVTGRDTIGTPHIYLKGMTPQQRVQIEQIALSYSNNPMSTITTAKAVLDNGFRKFIEHQGAITTENVRFFSRVFESPVWNKLDIIYHFQSEEQIELLKDMKSAGMSAKESIEQLTKFVADFKKWEKSGQTNGRPSMRELIDTYLMNITEQVQR